MAEFKDRSSIEILPMTRKCSIWLRNDTLENCVAILKFLKNDFQESEKKRKMTFAQLARATYIRPASVSSACYILAFKDKQQVHVWAEKSVGRGGKVFTRMRVRLI